MTEVPKNEESAAGAEAVKPEPVVKDEKVKDENMKENEERTRRRRSRSRSGSRDRKKRDRGRRRRRRRRRTPSRSRSLDSQSDEDDGQDYGPGLRKRRRGEKRHRNLWDVTPQEAEKLGLLVGLPINIGASGDFMHADRAGRRVYVGNLPLNVKETEIRDFFNAVMIAAQVIIAPIPLPLLSRKKKQMNYLKASFVFWGAGGGEYEFFTVSFIF